MGNMCCMSAEHKQQLQVVLAQPDIQKHMTQYNLTSKHIHKLYKLFVRSDTNHSNTIDSDELHTLFQEQHKTVFVCKLLELQLGNKKSLEFIDFIRLVTTFSLYTETDIIRFCYTVFDIDGSNKVDQNEFKTILSRLYEQQTNDIPTSVYTALQRYNTAHSSDINVTEFTELHLRYPQFLWPAFRLQFRIQELTLGMSTWSNLKVVHTGLVPEVLGNRPLCGLCICLPRAKLTPHMIVKKYTTDEDLQADAASQLRHKNAKLKQYHSRKSKKSRRKHRSTDDDDNVSRDEFSQAKSMARSNSNTIYHSSDIHTTTTAPYTRTNTMHRSASLHTSNIQLTHSSTDVPHILKQSHSLHNIQESHTVSRNRIHSMDDTSSDTINTNINHVFPVVKGKNLGSRHNSSAAVTPLHHLIPAPKRSLSKSGEGLFQRSNTLKHVQ